jgi:hypothetical protein
MLIGNGKKVKRKVAAEKLLVFRVEEGWEPLCAFLGVPVPDVPFPHVNDTQQFQSHLNRIRRVDSVLRLLTVATVAIAAYYFGSRYFDDALVN